MGSDKMDFKTKRISRKKIRELARLIRKIFNECISPNGLYVDVIKMFELVPVAFPCITTAIVEDIKLGRIPGRCNPDYNGNYTVEIKESVYDGAVLGVGGFRTHIMHELAHASRAAFPASRLLHLGWILLSGNMTSIRFCGHTRMQRPQPTHLLLSTTGGLPASTFIAAR